MGQMRVIAALLLTAGLISCMVSVPQTVRGRLEQEGHTPAYTQGYTDGCHTWRAQFKGRLYGNIQNEKSFLQDSQYREGWDDGYEHCKSKDQPSPPGLRIRD